MRKNFEIYNRIFKKLRFKIDFSTKILKKSLASGGFEPTPHRNMHILNVCLIFGKNSMKF